MIRSTTPSWVGELGQLLAAAAGDERERARRAARPPRRPRRRPRRARRWSAPPTRSRAARSRCPTSGTARRRRSSRSAAPRRRRRRRRAGRAPCARRARWAAGSRRCTSPTGSGSAAIVAHAGGDRRDAALVERQPVQQRGREPGLAAGLQVARVGLEDLRRPRLERVGDRVQRARPWSPSSVARERRARRAWRRRQMSVTEVGDAMAAMAGVARRWPRAAQASTK